METSSTRQQWIEESNKEGLSLLASGTTGGGGEEQEEEEGANY
jgi:hypothetical protein